MPTIEGKTYDVGHIHMNKYMTKEERDNHMICTVKKKYALKIGINKFKEQGESAVTKEPTKLHNLETFAPVDATKITKKKRAEAVASLMFLN